MFHAWQEDNSVEIDLAKIKVHLFKLYMNRINSDPRFNASQFLNTQLFKIQMLHDMASIHLDFDPTIHQVILILITYY